MAFSCSKVIVIRVVEFHCSYLEFTHIIPSPNRTKDLWKELLFEHYLLHKRHNITWFGKENLQRGLCKKNHVRECTGQIVPVLYT